MLQEIHKIKYGKFYKLQLFNIFKRSTDTLKVIKSYN